MTQPTDSATGLNPQQPLLSRLPNPPSYVEYDGWEFIIMDAPTDQNIAAYIAELEHRCVKTIVRACEPTYSAETLQRHGISVVDLSFPDGQPPSEDLIEEWLRICEREHNDRRPVAVHCVAGLGRSPVLVAIALLEFTTSEGGAEFIVERIRKARRGAISQRQLNYLKKYQPRKRTDCCVVL